MCWVWLGGLEQTEDGGEEGSVTLTPVCSSDQRDPEYETEMKSRVQARLQVCLQNMIQMIMLPNETFITSSGLSRVNSHEERKKKPNKLVSPGQYVYFHHMHLDKNLEL